MLSEPDAIVAALLAIEALVMWLDSRPWAQRVMRYLPSMFWIYFIPMLAALAGVLPRESPAYEAIKKFVLPAALVLLLLPVDVKAIVRLGPRALGLMLAGSAGIVLGAPLVAMALRPWLPDDAWMVFGGLGGSWTGGSANMLAVAEAIGAGKDSPAYQRMVVLDTIVPYVWMSLLILLSARQRPYDAWNRSNMRLIDDLARRAGGVAAAKGFSLNWTPVLLAVAAGGAAVAAVAAHYLPATPMLKGSAWMIIVATATGLGLSFTPARRLDAVGASKLGNVLLYLVLTCIGAGGDFSKVASAPAMLLAAVPWVLIHAGVLVLAGRLMRAPMALVAAASQANLGGTASAPVVAGVYQPQLAPVGLLLAIFGNIIGTALGLAAAWMCRAVSQ
jgi:uncharacterized membrane protein